MLGWRGRASRGEVKQKEEAACAHQRKNLLLFNVTAGEFTNHSTTCQKDSLVCLVDYSPHTNRFSCMPLWLMERNWQMNMKGIFRTSLEDISKLKLLEWGNMRSRDERNRSEDILHCSIAWSQKLGTTYARLLASPEQDLPTRTFVFQSNLALERSFSPLSDPQSRWLCKNG